MTLVDVVLREGLDETANKRVRKTGKPLTLDNFVYAAEGQLEQRGGLKQEYASLTGVNRLLDMGDGAGALVANSASLDSDLILKRRKTTAEAWATVGALARLTSEGERKVIFAQEGVTVRSHSMAVTGDYRCHIVSWLRGATIGIEGLIFDGDTLVSRVPYAGLARGRVVWDSTNSQWVIFAVNPTTDYLVRLNCTGPTADPPFEWDAIGDAVNVVAVYDGDVPSDVIWATGLYYYAAYLFSDQRVRWSKFAKADNASGGYQQLTAAVTDTQTLALDDTGTVVVWAIASSHVRCAIVEPVEVTVTVSEFTVFSAASASYVAVGGGWLSGSVVVYASSSLNLGTPVVATSKVLSATVNLTTGAVAALNYSPTYGWHLASTPICVDSREYVMGASYTDVSAATPGMRRHVLQQISTLSYPIPVLVGDPFVGVPPPTTLLDRPKLIGRRIHFPVVETSADGGTLALSLSTAVNGVTAGKSATDTVPGSVAVSGGVTSTIDNQGVVEHVPLVFPVIKSQIAATGTGVTGVVQYKAIYEVQDAAGRIGWSAPSPATAAITLADQRGQVTLPELHLTRMIATNEPRYKLYRSVGGGVYYLVSAGLLSRSSTGYTTLYDSVQDLSANEVLYTESGELPNQCPPFSTAVTSFKNRLWSASGATLYFTKELKSGYLPQWTAEFKITVPARVTALAPLGEILLVLCEDPDSTYYVSVPGNGPDDLGVGTYPIATLVSSNIGCSLDNGGACSVITVGSQAFWRSRRGIETMGTAQAVQQAGPQVFSDPVKSIVDGAPMVLDVTHVPGETAIYWTMRGLVATGGVYTHTVLRFDYQFSTWSTVSGSPFTRAGSLLGVGGDLVVAWPYYPSGDTDCGIWRSNGHGYDEVFAGTADLIFSTLILAPIRPFGPNGWGRFKTVRILGEYRGPCSGQLSVSWDDGLTYAYTQTVSLTDTDWDVNEPMPLRHKFRSQKANSVTLRLYLYPTTEEGAAPVLNAMTLKCDRLEGDRRERSKEYL